MKKRLLFVAAIFAATATFAQDGLTSKKGEAYLPEAGDWALGFDANPFLGYFGNLANATANNSISMPWTNGDMVITGKYFKDEKTAYRAKVRIGFGSVKDDSTYKAKANPSDLETSEFVNSTKTKHMEIALGFGLEKRKGNTRIQGFYGGEFGFMFGNFGNNGKTYEYGQALSDSLQAMGTVGPRNTEEKAGKTFGITLRGFIGVEWFVAPKVSIAAEYGWGLAMKSIGATETTTEKWGLTATETNNDAINGTTTPDHVITETTKGNKTSSFGIDTDNNEARLTLLFHF
ncbi:MAG: hypothetical protein A3K10_04205 [Bacteroidetes bacterium RIFCSPLOWO2_12_FULL_31_6]|nr:MAG: hypothetical protein A3K10_04205 [Bacteroidetes bacterium RIFCSPLOWO2_12_FULL_31_6]